MNNRTVRAIVRNAIGSKGFGFLDPVDGSTTIQMRREALEEQDLDPSDIIVGMEVEVVFEDIEYVGRGGKKQQGRRLVEFISVCDESVPPGYDEAEVVYHGTDDRRVIDLATRQPVKRVDKNPFRNRSHRPRKEEKPASQPETLRVGARALGYFYTVRGEKNFGFLEVIAIRTCNGYKQVPADRFCRVHVRLSDQSGDLTDMITPTRVFSFRVIKGPKGPGAELIAVNEKFTVSPEGEESETETAVEVSDEPAEVADVSEEETPAQASADEGDLKKIVAESDGDGPFADALRKATA